MKLYVVHFDNGLSYVDHESFTVGVFDSYDKAEKFILEQGYVKTKIYSLFGLMEGKKNFYNRQFTLGIHEEKLNERFYNTEIE
jgi:hypothetical protein